MAYRSQTCNGTVHLDVFTRVLSSDKSAFNDGMQKKWWPFATALDSLLRPSRASAWHRLRMTAFR